MSRRRILPRRSAREWLLRGGLAVLAVILGYTCFAQTRGYSLRNSDPARAYALAPDDGRVSAVRAQKLLEANTSPAEIAAVRTIARVAVLDDPTAVAAVSTLGIAAQLGGDVGAARRLYAYAQRLSRRDLPTQLWAIEDAVARGDVPGTLRHYDIALRTSRNASDLLFPILVSAIADPAIRTALTRTLQQKPGWAPLFVEYASANSPNPQATVRLFQDLRAKGVPVSDVSRMLLVDSLAARGRLNDAWYYYRSLHPGTDRRRSRDPAFSANLDNPTLFDWQMSGTEGVTGSIQREDNHGVLDFTALPGVGGLVAQQVQMLTAGRYRLTGRSARIDQPPGAQPYLVLNCRSGRELGRIQVPNSMRAGGRFSGYFDVPTDCPVQVLGLVARPADSVSGSAGQFAYIQLLPGRS